VMLVVLYLFTRSRFRIAFEWGRLVRLLLVFGGGAVAGELLLPTSGVAGLASRAALAAALPIVLILSGFFTRKERARALSVVSTRLRRSGESRRSRKTHRTGEV